MKLRYSDIQKKLSWKSLKILLDQEETIEITVEDEVVAYLGKHVPQAYQNQIGTSHKAVQPNNPKIEALRDLMKSVETGNRVKSVLPPSADYAPWYDPMIHKVGDKVRMRDGFGIVRVLMVPELDADGKPMWRE
jgi:hypothetical protein